MKLLITALISLLFFNLGATNNNNSKYIITPKTYAYQEKVDYSIWKELLNKYVSMDGKVNYEGFKSEKKKFSVFLSKLSRTKIKNSWSVNDKIAYWSNVYNAFTIKLIIENLPLKSIKDIKGPWKKKFFKINGQEMSLGDVEHRILRKYEEPRIHFIINCASSSCPRLLQIPYTGENIERLMERQTAEYINKSEANIITKKTYQLSQIFSWFSKDFKKNGSVIDFINKYSKIQIKNQNNKGFKKYDWALNSK